MILETLSDGAVSLVDDLQQRQIVLLKERLVLGFQLAKRLEDVARDDAGILTTHPHMRVDVAARRLGRLDACGCIYHLHIWSIILQLLHPGLFETDASHFQIEGTPGEFHHLLGIRLVSFRIVAVGYHHVDIHLISGNLINEKLVGRDSYGNSRFAIAVGDRFLSVTFCGVAFLLAAFTARESHA